MLVKKLANTGAWLSVYHLQMWHILDAILDLALDTAPWLLLGLLLAGLVKPLLPQALISRWLGGNGAGAVMRGSVIGVPLPLCSCGAIPTAIALYRAGAGRGPATSFLVSTPGVGIDSLTLSYALLGPVMMVARLLGAMVAACCCGLSVALTKDPPGAQAATKEKDACCADPCDTATPVKPSLLTGLRYALSNLWDDISLWIIAGILIAGVLTTVIPEQWLTTYGQGLPAMLLLAVIGVPLYVCASAATPIAAAMLIIGVSPGATLVFLLAAPITSMATLGVLWRSFGGAAMLVYVTAIMLSSIALGLILDGLIALYEWPISPQSGSDFELLPDWLQWGSLVTLAVLACAPLRRHLLFADGE